MSFRSEAGLTLDRLLTTLDFSLLLRSRLKRLDRKEEKLKKDALPFWYHFDIYFSFQICFPHFLLKVLRSLLHLVCP